jgi:hypothetical protein|tara:strand:- start:1136 stop:1417 length:282 start_codon:yes stop_codon:yes gene_type:complete
MDKTSSKDNKSKDNKSKDNKSNWAEKTWDLSDFISLPDAIQLVRKSGTKINPETLPKLSDADLRRLAKKLGRKKFQKFLEMNDGGMARKTRVF